MKLFSESILAVALASALLAACGGGGSSPAEPPVAVEPPVVSPPAPPAPPVEPPPVPPPVPVDPPPVPDPVVPPVPVVCAPLQTADCDISVEGTALMTALRTSTPPQVFKWDPALAAVATELAQAAAGAGTTAPAWPWDLMIAQGAGHYWFWHQAVMTGPMTVEEAVAKAAASQDLLTRSWYQNVGIGYYKTDTGIYWVVLVAG